jgi:hypothetical protein
MCLHAPVFPSETIVTEIRRECTTISFHARVQERDKMVLDHGKAVIALLKINRR